MFPALRPCSIQSRVHSEGGLVEPQQNDTDKQTLHLQSGSWTRLFIYNWATVLGGGKSAGAWVTATSFPGRDEYAQKMVERARQHAPAFGPLAPGPALRTPEHSRQSGMARQQTARTHGGALHAQVPTLPLDRVLPEVVRFATARESLRGMTRGERRPLTGLFSTGASSSPRAARLWQHGSQTERLQTADTSTALLSAGGMDAGAQHSLGCTLVHASASPRAPETARTPPGRLAPRSQIRQDELPGTENRYSSVRARVSNVCSMHTAQRRHEQQQQIEACKQGIYRSVTNENDPGAMVATKARATGVPAALPKVGGAHRKKPVQGTRPPSPSQSGSLEQLVFAQSGLFSNDRRLHASAQPVSFLHSSTFLTETSLDGDETIRADEREEETGTGGEKARKFDLGELNKEVSQRLQKSRIFVKPVVKNVAVVNEAIKVWLQSGARNVKLDHNDKALIKNNFDSNGTLKRDNYFERIRAMLEDQKAVISNPRLDLHLTDDLRQLSKGDFIGYNIEFVDAALPPVRNAQLLRQLLKRQKAVDQAMANRHKVAQEKLAHVHFEVERKLPGAKELKRNIQARETGLDNEIRQMLAGVVLVKAMRLIRYFLCAGRFYRLRRLRAARKIQKVMRMCLVVRHWGQLGGSTEWAVHVIRKFFRQSLQRLRQQNKAQYVELIKRFLFDASAANRVLKCARLLRASVLRIQRFIRRFLWIRRACAVQNAAAFDSAQHRVLKYLTKQQEKMKRARAQNPQKSERRTIYLNLFERRLSLENEMVELAKQFGLSREARNNTILRFMRAQRVQYLKDLANYNLELKYYHNQYEQQEMLVTRMMEFMGNDNFEEVKVFTDKLSSGQWEFRDPPHPVKLVLVATEDEMRELWWPRAVEECIRGRADELKNLILMLHQSSMLDTQTSTRIGPLLRPRAGRSNSPIRHSSPLKSLSMQAQEASSHAATDADLKMDKDSLKREASKETLP